MNASRTAQEWLDSARAAILRGELSAAQAELDHALADYPQSADLRRMYAGILQQTGNAAAAEQMLQNLLLANPGDTSSAFALSSTLKAQGRTAAAADAIRVCMATPPNPASPDLAIAAIELLDDVDRRRDAMAVVEAAIEATPNDPRLHAYAGMHAIQLGEFERAREHYLFTLQHDARAFEWHVAIGLAYTLRYRDASHPDFGVFREGLMRPDLSPLARAELDFSLGKALDDIGEYTKATASFRDGNAIRQAQTQWSAKRWRRLVAARLAVRRAFGIASPVPDFTPIFIVGVPRTGTTLLAELLSRHPRVCNRGELTALAHLAQQPAFADATNPARLRQAAATYASMSRQDDASAAHWFIDKQPLNFRYLDLALALFPDAKVVHCQRNARDTALSLWMRCFLEEEQGYAYDFGNMSLVVGDERRLMSHWHDLWPDSIRAVQYEDLVSNVQATVGAIAEWIGLPAGASEGLENSARSTSTISTASLWQARQPVHTRSIGRWKNYAQYVPELSRIQDT